MANKEPDKNLETCHLLIAVRRNKENKDIHGGLCFRVIDKGQESKDILLARIKYYPGTWRIYRTVNARNTKLALKYLMKRLIDEPEKFMGRVDSLWKTSLLQRECRAEKNILIDLDTKDDNVQAEISKIILDCGGADNFIVCKNTPNGYHFVCKSVDSRLLEKYEKDVVSIHRDGYVFIDRIVVERIE